MTSDDKIPGWVAVGIGVFVCIPCFLCSTFLAFFYLRGMFNPEWASQSVQYQEVLPSYMFGGMSAACWGTAIVALVGGIILLIWGLRRLRPRPA